MEDYFVSCQSEADWEVCSPTTSEDYWVNYQYYEACERSEQEYERSEEKPRIYSTYEQQQ